MPSVDGAKIRFLRESKTLSRAEAAARVNCDPQTFQRAENYNRISLAGLNNIARALGVPAGDLLSEKPPFVLGSQADRQFTRG